MEKLSSRGYLLIGEKESTFEDGLKIAAVFLASDSLNSHPDFRHFKNSFFSVGDAREIREASSRKSFSGRGRVFLVQADFWSKEACNALLKTLEEPAAPGCFILITPFLENIPVTLRSRLTVLKFRFLKPLAEKKKIFLKRFLSSLPSKRMEMIKKFLDEKEKAAKFLDGLQVVLKELLSKNAGDRELLFSLEEIEKCRRLLSGKGASIKMILEHLCLVLAKV